MDSDPKKHNEMLKLMTNPSIITLFFNFLQGHFDKIPKEMTRDILKMVSSNSETLQ